MARVTVAELQQHIVDIEADLAMRLEAQAARLDRIETDIAIIKEHLATRMWSAGRDSDPGAPCGPLRVDPQFVADRLGLTPHESRVAVLLAEGRSLGEIAEVMGNKTSTTRWFLRQIFRKLNISRQAQLVQAVLLEVCGKNDDPELDAQTPGP